MLMHARNRIAAGGAALLLALTACGDATSDWTFHGDGVREVDESLSAIEERWRGEIATADVAINVPDEAGCYLQVADDTIISEEVLCGPMRFFGSDGTTWVTAPLSGMRGQGDDVRLYVEDDAGFTIGAPSSNATAVDAEGTAVDTAQEVEAPAAPPAAVGDVIPLDPAAQAEVETTSLEIDTPDAIYRVSGVGLLPFAGSPSDPTGPPDGGSLVALDLTRDSKPNAPTSPVSSASLSAGGTEHEIPDGYAAVAVDGSDAVIAIEFDGNVQEYDINTGELVSGHPYAAQSFSPVNAPKGATVGERGAALSEVQHRVRVNVVSWDEDRGWAPDGKDRAYIAFSLSTDTEFGESPYAVDYDEQEYAVTALSISADGEEIPVDPSTVMLEPRGDQSYEDLEMLAMIVVDVPIGTEEIVVDGTVELTASIVDNEITQYQREHTDGEPESIQQSLDLEPVTLTRSQ